MDTNTQKNSRMTYIKEILILKPQLIDFSSMVLCHAAVLLLLTHSCRGQSQVTGPSQPIVAMVGDDILLPCYLETAMDAADITVEWARPDLEPRFVHLRRGGVELLLEEHPSYIGRTSLSVNKLKRGDVSLKLSKVKLSDVGKYRCLIPTSGIDSGVNLAVGAVSSPEIDISTVSNGVVLDCKSKGWYPEPEAFWLDGEGNLLSAGPTETVRGPDDLYTVSSRVTVEKRHSNSFTCRVQQKDINQTRETHIQVPAELFMVQSSFAVRITICLAACILSVVAIVVVLWKWGQNKTIRERKTWITLGNNTELQLLMEGEREQLMTESEKMKYLNKTKAKLDEELQKNEGELEHIQQLITALMEQKKDLKNQREKLISLQQEDKIQTQEYEKKLKTKPKTNKDKKKKKRETTIKFLEKRATEHEELLKNTEKLLETTDNLIIRMTERKGKLGKDNEQINKYLKDTKRQREEVHRKLQVEQSKREEEINETSSEPDRKTHLTTGGQDTDTRVREEAGDETKNENQNNEEV